MRLVFCLFLFLPFLVQGQEAYPSKNVRLIAAAAPGGNPDVLARMLAAKLGDAFGKPFIVENIPGAGGVVAAEQVARATADGHTLMLGDSGAMAINVALNPKLSYHPTRDFTLITALAAVPTVLVLNPTVSGKLRVLCISTISRSASLPDVPTAAELGFAGFDIATVIGLQAPAGLPREIGARLQGAAAKALRERDVAERMANLGMELRENGSEHYARFAREDLERYVAAVKAAGVKRE